jgi:hypothetical protein
VAAKVATSHRDTLALLRDAIPVIESRTKRGRFPDPNPRRQGVLIGLKDAHEVLTGTMVTGSEHGGL